MGTARLLSSFTNGNVMETHERHPTDLIIESLPIVSVVPGQVIGDRYRIEETLGWGGMGVVCRATHLGLGTPVAIKLIRADFACSAKIVQRFMNEARRAAVLQSERIARVHDVGQLGTGEPYLVMELLDGLELGQYLNECGPLPVDDAVNIALQICEGLAEAHASGIVHRDIKPANVFLVRRSDGRFAVKLLDFGISKQLGDGPTTLTDSRQSLGSPWYMSPEQMLDASSVDARSDLWSLGVVLFEMLTGRRPFDGTTVPEVCAKVLSAPAPAARDFRPDIAPELAGVVARCLQKKPDRRYPDATTLGAELGDYAAHHVRPAGASVESTSYFQRNAREGSIAPLSTTRTSTRRRRRWAHALASFGLLATLGVGALALGKRMDLVVAARAPGSAAAAPLPAPPPPAPIATPAVTASQPPTPVEALPDVPSPALVAPTPVVAAPTPVVAAPTPVVTAPEPADAGPPAAATAAVEQGEPGAFRPRERPLSAGEIQARKERYARWLEHEGLTRIE